MDRDTKIQAADVIASQINAAIIRSNMNDDEKGILAGSIARLLQLTAEISAAAHAKYKVRIILKDNKGNEYGQTIMADFPPKLPVSLGNGPILDENSHMIHNIVHGYFILMGNEFYNKTDLIKWGFAPEEE